jgi:CBS domain containing-hemolysin-like protein
MKNKWLIHIFILTFILAIIFSTVSNVIAATFNEIVLFIILLLVIFIGIVFDCIGVSVITANEATFHSMSSRKIKGAKETISLIKNSSRISSICNDVVGDVSGIISGSIGAVLAISLSTKLNINNALISIIISALISSLTVGGKAIVKGIAIKNADKIIFIVGKIKYYLKLKG